MEATRSSEVWVHFYHTTRHHIAEHSVLHDISWPANTQTMKFTFLGHRLLHPRYLRSWMMSSVAFLSYQGKYENIFSSITANFHTLFLDATEFHSRTCHISHASCHSYGEQVAFFAKTNQAISAATTSPCWGTQLWTKHILLAWDLSLRMFSLTSQLPFRLQSVSTHAE
jgi:hypothetical protein